MKANELHLQYLGTYQYQNKLWFSNGGFNGLFALDLKDFSVEYKQAIPYLDTHIQWAYYGNIQCAYEDKWFLFPFNCRQIMVYDFKSNEIQGIPITPMNGSDIYMTAGVFQKDNKVWILPGDMSLGIFVLDLEKMQLEQDIELNELLKDVSNIYNYENVIRLNEEEVAILSGTNTIMRVNIVRKEIISSKCFAEEMSIWSIKHDGGNYWLLPYESTCVYEWCPDNDKLTKYELLERDSEWIDIPGSPYINMIFWDNEIILLPSRLRYLMKIDKEANIIKKAIDYPGEFKFLRNQFGIKRYPAFGAFDIIDDKLILHPLLGNMLLIYDLKQNHIEGIELIVSQDEVSYVNEIILAQGQLVKGIFYEKNVYYGINVIIAAAYNKCGYEKDSKRNNIGNKIYHTIKRVIQ